MKAVVFVVFPFEEITGWSSYNIWHIWQHTFIWAHQDTFLRHFCILQLFLRIYKHFSSFTFTKQVRFDIAFRLLIQLISSRIIQNTSSCLCRSCELIRKETNYICTANIIYCNCICAFVAWAHLASRSIVV